MGSTILGIDLGTQNIKICSNSAHHIICEKNVIAQEGNKLYAYGNDAYEMFEKAPDNIIVDFPVKSGVIADYKEMRDILVSFLNKNFGNKMKGATVIIAVPTDISEVEKRSYFDLVASCKYKLSNILVCEKPIAAAIGLGLPINDATGMMVIDVGADTTEVSVLSLGGIVISRLIKVGGNKMAESLAAAIKRDKNLVIGAKTAEKLLSEIGYAVDPADITMKTVGRNMLTGFPISLDISAQDVYGAIKEYFDQIVDSVKFILERTPPELTSDIIDNGIYLTGGVSQIRNLDTLLSRETDLDVNVSGSPIENVALGLEKIASDRSLSNLAYSMSSPKNRFRK